MAKERMEATFTETTVAATKTELDAWIARIWATQTSPSAITMDLTMYITASDGTNAYTFKFGAKLEDDTDTLLLAMTAALYTGISATVTASDYDAITAVYGTAKIVITY